MSVFGLWKTSGAHGFAPCVRLMLWGTEVEVEDEGVVVEVEETGRVVKADAAEVTSLGAGIRVVVVVALD